ncbi:adenine deaminase C-terminal domain-containing protein [Alkalibacillus haloalkaliphilus]|uniref:adenine deaminase C-terminal domain-containing protein n=1 Tax=Alkalibacillus haloalkaliphilus TaxID=94136 RepID=UPI002936B6F5|nr:adenine deaminase C-terminal domain-containing protein [Alkalibacillus haloalkaliphilus]MDV2581708.1 adenine deaminase C-terminal domain-containing protein [Alkalibacillus haloalkaliphilus]
MKEHLYRWRNKQLREHTAVVDGEMAPTLVLKNATYLNVYLKKWLSGHIWIYEDRIVYVGDQFPGHTSKQTEVVDCSGQYLVPGYIEAHAHPFQLYNPHSLAEYASKRGTTTLVNDNLMLLLLLNKKKAFSLLDDMQNLPVSMFWWARFDSQSELRDEEGFLDDDTVVEWLEHEAVIQGGELTNWPEILTEDDRSLYWMQEAKRMRKVVEGHFPGASEKTLTKMKLLGTDGDHESISAEEVYSRVKLGYYAGLRYSSIRPDLPKMLEALKEYEGDFYNYLFFTTDGSTPSFYEQGVIDRCIDIALEAGVPLEEAYAMATINAAHYFSLGDRLGSIAPGRVAHINFLEAKDQPTPVKVLAKGEWINFEGYAFKNRNPDIKWENYGLGNLSIDWELRADDLLFSSPLGMDMLNDVIMKPYPVKSESQKQKLPTTHDIAYVMLVDRDGNWRISSFLKGFTTEIGGLVSSYSNTGDIVLVGKDKRDMSMAFERMKELGGAIVVVKDGEVIFELPLPLQGVMTDLQMDELMVKEKELKQLLIGNGYQFSDPIYTLLFLSSTHLPYIRITPKGLMDVKKKEILFPSVMR